MIRHTIQISQLILLLALVFNLTLFSSGMVIPSSPEASALDTARENVMAIQPLEKYVRQVRMELWNQISSTNAIEIAFGMSDGQNGNLEEDEIGLFWGWDGECFFMRSEPLQLDIYQEVDVNLLPIMTNMTWELNFDRFQSVTNVNVHHGGNSLFIDLPSTPVSNFWKKSWNLIRIVEHGSSLTLHQGSFTTSGYCSQIVFK